MEISRDFLSHNHLINILALYQIVNNIFSYMDKYFCERTSWQVR